MHTYFRLFFTSVIFWAIAKLIINSIILDKNLDFVPLFFEGVIFGTLFSVIAGYMHRAYTKDLPDGVKTKPSQSRVFELPVPVSAVFENSIGAMIQLGAKINLQDKKSGTIEARTKMSSVSSGEILKIQVVKLDEHITQVEISSTPKFNLIGMDCGKGYKNVEKITDLLTGDV